MSKQLSLFEQKNVEQQTIFDKPGLELFFDGAARGNPGPSGIGIVIKRARMILFRRGFFVGEKTNNQAEYLALIVGVIAAREILVKGERLLVYGDSNLLIQQMNGQYRVKNPILQQMFRAAHMLTSEMDARFTHIYRHENGEADRAANQGIDTKTSVPEHYKKVLHAYHIKI